MPHGGGSAKCTCTLLRTNLCSASSDWRVSNSCPSAQRFLVSSKKRKGLLVKLVVAVFGRVVVHHLGVDTRVVRCLFARFILVIIGPQNMCLVSFGRCLIRLELHGNVLLVLFHSFAATGSKGSSLRQALCHENRRGTQRPTGTLLPGCVVMGWRG